MGKIFLILPVYCNTAQDELDIGFYLGGLKEKGYDVRIASIGEIEKIIEEESKKGGGSDNNGDGRN